MFPTRTVTAKNSVVLLDAFRAEAKRKNGGASGSPNLRNGELLQLADYYKQHGESGYHSLARIALGFFKEGDKFQAGTKFSVAHANAAVPRGLLPSIWIRMRRMSKAIDKKDGGATAQFTPSSGTSKTFWDFMAAAAFRQLQRERARRGVRPPPIPDPRKTKPPPGLLPPPRKGGGGLGLLIVVALVALAASKG